MVKNQKNFRHLRLEILQLLAKSKICLKKYQIFLARLQRGVI